MKNNLKAYEDIAFLKRPECRPVRLQLEMLKPEIVMAEHNIRSTIVIFGSARLPAPERAQQNLEKIKKAFNAAPENKGLQQQVKRAERWLALSHYYDVAREFARIVSQASQQSSACEYTITTGGGGGIMEAGNRGAHDVGAKSIGLNISLPFEQHPNRYITDDLSFNFHYFNIRKMHFLLRAKAMCAFPGGFGTMDELFEALTLIQTQKITPMPVVLFGEEFWSEFINWDVLVEHGFISPGDLDIFHYCETAAEGWDYIRAFWHNGNGLHPHAENNEGLSLEAP